MYVHFSMCKNTLFFNNDSSEKWSYFWFQSNIMSNEFYQKSVLVNSFLSRTSSHNCWYFSDLFAKIFVGVEKIFDANVLVSCTIICSNNILWEVSLLFFQTCTYHVDWLYLIGAKPSLFSTSVVWRCWSS